MKHVIIGSGPAGLSAAATLRRVDPAASVTLLTREALDPYPRMALPYLLSGRIGEKDFFLTPPPGTERLPGAEVVRIDAERRAVETAAGKRIPWDRLLIASGASPEKPQMPGGDLPFVFTVRDYADIVGIRTRLGGRTGRAVIAGAGPVGMEMGDALRELGLSITFVVGSPRVFSTLLDAPAAEWFALKLREKGVEVLTGDEITGIGADGAVALRSGETRACDLVIFGKGVRPHAPFLAGSGIDAPQGIAVNERQETNVPGVYAAGDAVRSRDLVSGEMRVNALWPVAVEQGRVAALNMAGVPATGPGSFSRNILRVFGISVITAGTGRAEGDGEVRTAAGPDFYRKIVLERGVLKGCLFLGEERNAAFYDTLIATRADVSACAGSLLQGSYRYGRRLAQACHRAP